MKNYFLVLLYLFLCNGTSYCQITVYPAILEDSYTLNSPLTVGSNYGSDPALTVHVVTASTRYYRSFLKYDFGGIPTNAIIISAKIQLTPIGTENITSPSSTELTVDFCNTSWGEFTLTHNTGISNNTIFTSVSSSNLVSGKRELEVKDFVQAIVSLRAPNNGFRIRRNPESTATLVAQYHSRQASDSTKHPKMVLQYYIPASVSSAAIVLPTTTTSGNGSISPTIINGTSGTKTYQWYNSSLTAISGAINLNLTGQNPGWYGLKVTGAGDPGDVTYHAFLLGVKCSTINVTFAPDGNYIDDTYMINNVTGSGTTAIFNTQVNNGGAGALPASENISPMTTEGLLKFRLWFDPNLTVNSANLTLYGNGHAPTDRANDSYLKLVNTPWTETSVAYTNKPTSLTSPSVTINSIAAGNGNATVNIASLVNNWKLNNPQNYGCHFQLTYYEGTTTKMQFNSSDAAAGVRPSLVLNVTSNDCSTNNNLYYIPKEYVGPEIADLLSTNKKLRIRYKDYFDTDLNLQYSIKGITDDAAITGPVVTKPDHTNWITIDLTSAGLTTGNIYLLELIDSSGKKEYLKFKVI